MGAELDRTVGAPWEDRRALGAEGWSGGLGGRLGFPAQGLGGPGQHSAGPGGMNRGRWAGPWSRCPTGHVELPGGVPGDSKVLVPLSGSKSGPAQGRCGPRQGRGAPARRGRERGHRGPWAADPRARGSGLTAPDTAGAGGARAKVGASFCLPAGRRGPGRNGLCCDPDDFVPQRLCLLVQSA